MSVADLLPLVEGLGPEACLRKTAVETKAADLMASETIPTAKEACGRLQLMLVTGRESDHRDTHLVSHLHVACTSNRLLLM